MLRYLIFFSFSVFWTTGLYIVNPGPKYPPTKGEVWPKPQYQKYSYQYYTFNPSQFVVNATKETCDLLTRAIERYSFIVRNTNNVERRMPGHSRRKRLQPDHIHDRGDHQGLIRELVVELTAPCESKPYFGMDESYDLIVSKTSKLSAASIWGILRGLETWCQLFYVTNDYNEVRINATHITDFPRFLHRGLLLDTSRHYISLGNIMKTLDAMAMNKLNVLHWHIVDDQSFPYQSEKFPDLSAKGAFHPTLVYTKEDIQLVVASAKERGIRVLPEFDVPGHTRSWGEAYPELLTECFQGGKVVGLGPMDPTRNDTYNMLHTLIQEIQEWFPDKYFHVGGDEVDMDCWKSNPNLQRYMKKHNMTVSQLHGLFMAKVIPLLGSRSQPIVWQEVFDEGVRLSSDTIVQVWKDKSENEITKILEAGHRLIFSSAWYLDHLLSGGDWTNFYLSDPRQMVNATLRNTTLLENIVGGEACMWGEVVDDTNVISRVWPRASAVAERLWSAGLENVHKNRDWIIDTAARRLEEHTCRMRRRGVRAQPPNGPGVCLGAA